MADHVVEDKEKSQGRFLTNAGLQGIIVSGFAGLAAGLANVATSSYLIPGLDKAAGLASGIWSFAADKNKSWAQIPGRLGRAALTSLGGYVAFNIGELVPELFPMVAREGLREGWISLIDYFS